MVAVSVEWKVMAAFLLSHVHYAWLVLASLIAGTVNAVASGGSFISFPAMLAVGIAPVQANATNTVAIWPGQLTSLVALRGDLRKDLLPVLMLCAVAGGTGGALILLHTPQAVFVRVIPWLILLATVLFLFSARISAWLRRETEQPHETRRIGQAALAAMMLPVCLYVGYFGAGGGLMIMASLAVLGVDSMRELNSLKVLVACVANLSAVITFIVSGAVVWHFCLVAMVFAGLGGYLGAHYSQRMPARALRMLVLVAGFSVAAWFFYRNATGHS